MDNNILKYCKLILDVSYATGRVKPKASRDRDILRRHCLFVFIFTNCHRAFPATDGAAALHHTLFTRLRNETRIRTVQLGNGGWPLSPARTCWPVSRWWSVSTVSRWHVTGVGGDRRRRRLCSVSGASGCVVDT